MIIHVPVSVRVDENVFASLLSLSMAVHCSCIFTLESISLWWRFVDYRLYIQLAEKAERDERDVSVHSAQCAYILPNANRVCHWANLCSTNFSIAIKMNLQKISMIQIDGNGGTGSTDVKCRKNHTQCFIRKKQTE